MQSPRQELRASVKALSANIPTTRALPNNGFFVWHSQYYPRFRLLNLCPGLYSFFWDAQLPMHESWSRAMIWLESEMIQHTSKVLFFETFPCPMGPWGKERSRFPDYRDSFRPRRI